MADSLDTTSPYLDEDTKQTNYDFNQATSEPPVVPETSAPETPHPEEAAPNKSVKLDKSNFIPDGASEQAAPKIQKSVKIDPADFVPDTTPKKTTKIDSKDFVPDTGEPQLPAGPQATTAPQQDLLKTITFGLLGGEPPEKKMAPNAQLKGPNHDLPDYTTPSGEVVPGEVRKQTTEFLQQYQDKDMAQRILNPQNYPTYDNGPRVPSSTHKMTSLESDGKYYAIPELFHDPQTNELVPAPKDPTKALAEAIRRNDFIEFKTDAEAKWFAKNGYKAAWGAGNGEKTGLPAPAFQDPVTSKFNNIVEAPNFKEAAPEHQAADLEDWLRQYQGTDNYKQAQTLVLQHAAKNEGFGSHFPTVETQAEPPPAWDTVKSSPGFNEKTTDEKKATLDHWSQLVQNYEDRNFNVAPNSFTPGASSLPEYVLNQAENLHYVPQYDPSRPVNTAAQGLAQGVNTGATSYLAFEGGAAAGAPFGAPLGPLGSSAAALIGGGLAMAAKSKLSNDAVQYLADNGFSTFRNMLDTSASNPSVRVPYGVPLIGGKLINSEDAGDTLVSLGVGALSGTKLYQNFGTTKELYGLTKAITNTGAHVVAGVTLAGGMDAATQYLTTGKVDKNQVALSMATGILNLYDSHDPVWTRDPEMKLVQQVATRVRSGNATEAEKQFLLNVGWGIDKKAAAKEFAAKFNMEAGGTIPKTADATGDLAAENLPPPPQVFAPSPEELKAKQTVKAIIGQRTGQDRIDTIIGIRPDLARGLGPEQLPIWTLARKDVINNSSDEAAVAKAKDDLATAKNEPQSQETSATKEPTPTDQAAGEPASTETVKPVEPVSQPEVVKNPVSEFLRSTRAEALEKLKNGDCN